MGLVTLSRTNPSGRKSAAFLPTTCEEMKARGWDQLDILIVNGDAYVDHPAFGGALIGRFLEGRGYRVGMIAQPDWKDTKELLRMGAPRLFVGITAGNLDSMLNKLTAQKKVRSDDQYSPGGQVNQRPNRASVAYSNLCRAAFPGVPLSVNDDIRSRVTYSVNVSRLIPDDMQLYLLAELDKVALAHSTFTKDALALIIRSADGILRRARNIALSSLYEAVRDSTRVVDLKQINRVLLQPHWQSHHDAD